MAGSDRQGPVEFRNRLFHRTERSVRDAAVEMGFAVIGHARQTFAKLLQRFLSAAETEQHIGAAVEDIDIVRRQRVSLVIALQRLLRAA